jgi:hypothetical protein
MKNNFFSSACCFAIVFWKREGIFEVYFASFYALRSERVKLETAKERLDLAIHLLDEGLIGFVFNACVSHRKAS